MKNKHIVVKGLTWGIKDLAAYIREPAVQRQVAAMRRLAEKSALNSDPIHSAANKPEST